VSPCNIIPLAVSADGEQRQVLPPLIADQGLVGEQILKCDQIGPKLEYLPMMRNVHPIAWKAAGGSYTACYRCGSGDQCSSVGG
jgi:hypothetical protein